MSLESATLEAQRVQRQAEEAGEAQRPGLALALFVPIRGSQQPKPFREIAARTSVLSSRAIDARANFVPRSRSAADCRPLREGGAG